MNIKSMAAVLALIALIAGCDKSVESEGAQTTPMTTQDQKLSYIFGQNIGTQLKSETIDIDVAILADGIRDALAEAEPKLAEAEVMEVLQAFQEAKMAEQQKTFDSQSEKNRQEGEAFLADNATKEGVVTLDSGLQYEVISAGEGASPGPEDTVEVHYRGTLLDGTEFDSSYKRGVPATFGVNQVIPGWTEALQLMKEGAKWVLYIPPSLAYGPGGTGGPIGPEQTLKFEVELLKASVVEDGVDQAKEE